ncbi:MAG TPA: cobalt-precorrin-5B (C(1))-methyltransferase CbiD [Desulfomonilaceae bacterium]|nr:cobalt-precorrin-5B (C(1))-methyltransferase CbiD [Desulfomonilaceae bacterium]
MNSWRSGYTTGTCAAAAAKAAAIVLCGGDPPLQVDVPLPNGTHVTLSPVFVRGDTASACAAVRKDAGDDPDVTDGCMVTASVEWSHESEIAFSAGEGVGTVTKPGLSIPPGEPAINPVPRAMIREAVRSVTARGVHVTISIPGGRALAEKTFNPRLGVQGGLSILGTSGIVRPFSTDALRDALTCALSVAVACGVTSPVFVPGRIGEKAAKALFRPTPEQLIEVGNEWGFMLDSVKVIPFQRLLVVGHPGKLAKLIAGWWDTHSSRSGSAVPAVMDLGRKIPGLVPEHSATVEGVFQLLGESERSRLAHELASAVRKAVFERVQGRFPVAVTLVNMQGVLLGEDGDTAAWR